MPINEAIEPLPYYHLSTENHWKSSHQNNMEQNT